MSRTEKVVDLRSHTHRVVAEMEAEAYADDIATSTGWLVFVEDPMLDPTDLVRVRAHGPYPTREAAEVDAVAFENQLNSQTGVDAPFLCWVGLLHTQFRADVADPA